ncbi:MAG: CDP-diacylglycerol--glycerol-3-phosphate 3-phosphatidyltransferase [Clostridia bacterium]|nr:CDP-diacylglycerol--glycerol-3-phosphate 3-phosphatidyltransferase [Clostridia bacterium]
MNLPNKLTIIRFILTPIFMALMMIDFPFHYFVAFLVFIAASITDYFDGKIAREQNLITDFGKFLDPIADKALTTAAFIVFCFLRIGKGIEWVLFIILLREFVVTSVRLAASANGKVVAANIYGKLKTVVQMVTICTLIFFMGVFQEFGTVIPTLYHNLFDIVATVLLWITAVLTLIAGVTYIIDNKEFINHNK